MFGSFLLLAAFPASPFVVPLIFVLLYGAGSGVAAVARALLPLSFFTREEFATLSAMWRCHKTSPRRSRPSSSRP